jgi:hypothetical protein
LFRIITAGLFPTTTHEKTVFLFKLPNWHNWHNNNVAGLQADEAALYTGNVTDGGNDGSQPRFIQIPA